VWASIAFSTALPKFNPNASYVTGLLRGLFYLEVEVFQFLHQQRLSKSTIEVEQILESLQTAYDRERVPHNNDGPKAEPFHESGNGEGGKRNSNEQTTSLSTTQGKTRPAFAIRIGSLGEPRR
jgi:hypothetical protein